MTACEQLDAALQKGASQLKILIVDDLKDAAFITSRLLMTLGYKVDIAYSGHSAIEKAEVLLPDVILMDIFMPDMNGYETCKKMRSIDALKNTAIFALTGLESLEARQQAENAGFNDIILKTRNIEYIHQMIENLQP